MPKTKPSNPYGADDWGEKPEVVVRPSGTKIDWSPDQEGIFQFERQDLVPNPKEADQEMAYLCFHDGLRDVRMSRSFKLKLDWLPGHFYYILCSGEVAMGSRGGRNAMKDFVVHHFGEAGAIVTLPKRLLPADTKDRKTKIDRASVAVLNYQSAMNYPIDDSKPKE